jgi:1-acyl-sn-glycerol-3-phosphate acyltransferase
MFRRLGPAIAKVNPWRLHITGTDRFDRSRVYVIVSNHQSLADIPLIAHINFDAKWLAKAELFRVPFVGWMMSMSDDVPVIRSDRRKAAHALLQCARYLRQGCSVVFFPEGTRSRDGQVLPFNDGPFQLAIRERVPVLPLVLDGSRDALPRNSWLFGNTLDMYLRVLDPVPVEELTVKDAAKLREDVRQYMITELLSHLVLVFVGSPRPEEPFHAVAALPRYDMNVQMRHALADFVINRDKGSLSA